MKFSRFPRPPLIAWSLACLLAVAAKAEPEPGAFRIFVSDERSGEVTVLDGATLEATRTFAVGKRPRGLHLSADGKRLYVATSGSPRMGPGVDAERAKSAAADKSADGIAVIDPAKGEVLRRLDVGSDPEQFALSRDGRRAIVANEDAASASIWDLETGREVATSAVGAEPEGVTLHPTKTEAWVTCEEEGDVFVLHPETGQQLARLRLGGRPRTVVFSPDGALAYLPLETDAAIAVVDAKAYRLLEKIPVPPPALPMGSAISADGREVFVSTGRGNKVVVLDTEARRIVAEIAVGERPWGLALSPDGRRLFSANGGSDDVSVIDTATRQELRRVKVGAGPWGLAVGVTPGP